MKKVKKIIISIIAVMCITIILFNNFSYAVVTKDDAGFAIAQFSKNYIIDYSQQTEYGSDNAEAYKGNDIDGKYQFNEVGWISFVIHNSLGAGNADNSYTKFVTLANDSSNTIGVSNGFEFVKGGTDVSKSLNQKDVERDIREGDILFETGGKRVAIYVGGNEVIYCTKPDSDGEACLYQIDLYEDTSKKKEEKEERTVFKDYCAIARITEDTAKNLKAGQVTSIFNEQEDGDYNKYYGTTQGRYAGSYNVLSWLFNKFLGFLDYLFGIIAYVIRAPFVGWANIIENIINDTINNVSGVTTTDVPEYVKSNNSQNNQEEKEETEETNANATSQDQRTTHTPNAMDSYVSKRINIEDLIYNNVPLLDVDLFDLTLSKYKDNNAIKITDDSIMYKLRESIAIWYYTIRSISIVAMLLVLIYLGIRLAIATTSSGKTKYKEMLIGWVVAFIVIFLIHYFMILIIDLNEILISYLKELNEAATGGMSLYDTIRTRAYSLKLSEGVPATVIYLVLIYFLIRFLYIYVKRYFTVNILALMGPIMGIKYAIEKINKGNSGSIAAWMWDFSLNVFLQSVHAILYTVFMSMAFKFALQSVPGFILGLCILNFIFKAEEIFMKVFRFDDRSRSLNEVNAHKNFFKDAYLVTSGIGYMATSTVKFGIGAVKNTTKYVGMTGLATAQIGVSAWNRHKYSKEKQEAIANGNEIPEYKAIDVYDSFKGKIEKLKNGAADAIDDEIYKLTGERSLRLGLHRIKETDPTLYYATKNLLNENRKMKRETMKRSISAGTVPIRTLAKLVSGVPMMVVDPGAGYTMLYTSLNDIKDMNSDNPHYGHRTSKQIRGRRGRVAAALLTGAAYTGYNNTQKNMKNRDKALKKIRKNEALTNNLRRGATLESEIEKQLADLEFKKNDTGIDEFNKLKEETIKQSVDSVLSSRNIKSAVSEYMRRNNKTRLQQSDIESIMKEFNISNVEKEVSKLQAKGNSEINKLKEQIEELKITIEDTGREVGDEISAKQIGELEGQVDRKTQEMKIIQKVGEEISRSESIDAGILKGKRNIESTVKEYMQANNIEELKESDVKEIVDLFNEKIKDKKQDSTYTTKEGVSKEFEKRKESNPKGLDKKKSVDAILDAILKEGNPKVDSEFEDVAKKVRELKTLNEKTINTHGKSVVSIAEFTKKINGKKK